jgi:Arc/MetJ family transcription regulator
MTKTLIDIPDELLDRARAALGGVTKSEAVRQSLAETVRQHEQLEALAWFVETDAVGDLRDPEVRAAARR